MNEFQIAFVESRTSGVAKSFPLDWGKLSQRLARCDIGEKDGSGWMPVEIEPGRRTAERVKAVSVLVLDVEAKAEMVEGEKQIIGPEPPTFDEMESEIKQRSWASILHTTFSHTPAHSRYRLAIRLSRPMGAAEVRPLGSHVAAVFGISESVDRACLEPARLFYLPRCHAERLRLFRHAETKGDALPVDELLAEAARYDEAIKAPPKPRNPLQSGGESVIGAFNVAHDVGAILEQHGYKPFPRNRWLWPGSTSGIPGVRLLPDSSPPRVYSSHGGDSLNDEHGHDAFDVFCILKHGGDVKAAVKAAAALLGMKGPPAPVSSKAQGAGVGAPASGSDDESIQRLAHLGAVEYDRVRKEQATVFGIQLKTLDAIVKTARAAAKENEQSPFAEVEPHPDEIDPGLLLDEVSDAIRNFIVLDSEQAHAAALWVAFTWFTDVVEVAPLAIINAPEKACGKSQMLALFGRMVSRPLLAANSTPAALFRSVEKWNPTVLIDEADTFIRESDELKGLINAGHTRDNAFVLRVVGDDHEPRQFSVWGAKALAGISLEKHLSDATMSRAIVFELRRKLDHEKVKRLRHADGEVFKPIARKLARFAADFSQQVKEARPTAPEALTDRQQDNWEPLFAIAACAGARWGKRATVAALKLSNAGRNTASTGNELLGDIQHVFESKHVSKISSVDLIAALCEDQEEAWATYNRGKPITPRQVARQLGGYGIASKSVRLSAYATPKGFELSQFSDVFARYLSTPPNSPKIPQQTPEANSHALFSVADDPQHVFFRNNSETPEAAPVLGSGAVAHVAANSGGVRAREQVDDSEVI